MATTPSSAGPTTRSSAAGVSTAWVATSRLEAGSAPRYRACTAANRFIVDDSGPGTQTRDAAPSPVSSSTALNESVHDAVDLTTTRGRDVDPDVGSATGSPRSWAPRNAAT